MRARGEGEGEGEGEGYGGGGWGEGFERAVYAPVAHEEGAQARLRGCELLGATKPGEQRLELGAHLGTEAVARRRLVLLLLLLALRPALALRRAALRLRLR